MAEFLRLKLMPLEKQLQVAQSEWQRAASQNDPGLFYSSSVVTSLPLLSCL